MVPGTPVGKERARVTKFGNYTPPKTRSAEAVIKAMARAKLAGIPPIAGPVILSLKCTFVPAKSWSRKRQVAALAGIEWPTKKPDIDNILKLVKDSLNGVVYLDDAQVVRVEAEKVYGPEAQMQIFVGRL